MTETITTDSQGELESAISTEYERNIERRGARLDIEIASQTEIDNLKQNETIKVKDSDGNIEFQGVIKEIPREAPGNVRAYGGYRQLQNHESNGRVFYEVPVSTVMNKLVTENIEQKHVEIAHACDTLTDVTTDMPSADFELAEFQDVRPDRYGRDMIFAAWNANDATYNGEWNVTFDNIVPEQGDEILKLFVRIIINNQAENIRTTIEYRDYNGQNYVWRYQSDELNGAENIELNIEQANTGIEKQLTTNNRLQFRFKLEGNLIEPRAIAIDVIQIATATLTTRDHDYTTVDIPTDIGQNITRKFNQNLSESLNTLQDKIPHELRVDESTIELIEPGANTASLEINESTPITNYEQNVDYDKITNRLIIDTGDFVVRRENKESQEFYNTTNTKRIRDTSIERKQDAEQTALNILNENAFTDTELQYTTPLNNLFQNITEGDAVEVNYKGVNGTFTATKIKSNTDGTYTITLQAKENQLN